jgi:zinc transporter
MGPVIHEHEDAIDELEDRVLSASSSELRVEIADVRRRGIALRRYLAPQRDVLSRLQNDRIDFFESEHKLRFRENADQLTRYVENLDTIRERATIVSEELQNGLAERVNANMYLLSLVAGVFLPLGFLTGLLGINVGGIPGTEYPWAFGIVTGCLLLVGLVELWLLRRLRMF